MSYLDATIIATGLNCIAMGILVMCAAIRMAIDAARDEDAMRRELSFLFPSRRVPRGVV